MSLSDRLAAFKALDGFHFWHGSTAFVLRTGRYASGDGAIQICGSDGQLESNLTVALEGKPKPNEFFVRLHEASFSMHNTIIATGWFTRTKRFMPSGYVANYAEVWTFSICDGEMHSMRGLFTCAECTECQALAAARYEEGKTRVLAKDAVRRIRTMGGSDQW